MQSREYHIQMSMSDHRVKTWHATAVYGLMQTEIIYGGQEYSKKEHAVSAAKQHAAADNVKPIIINGA